MKLYVPPIVVIVAAIIVAVTGNVIRENEELGPRKPHPRPHVEAVVSGNWVNSN